MGDLPSGRPSYVRSVLLDRHGLGGTFEECAAAVRAMNDGTILTAADGHSFRILPPEQPQELARPTVEFPAAGEELTLVVEGASQWPAAEVGPCRPDVSGHGSARLPGGGPDPPGRGERGHPP